MGLKLNGLETRAASICAAAIVLGLALLAAGCTTANVGTGGGPLFDASEIAPMDVRVSSAEGGGVEIEVVTRGVGLAQGVLVFADGTVETAELSGVTASLGSENTSGLVCLMLQVSKNGDYWYFDNGHDYWYFDNTGALMTMEEGASWYPMY